jgi:NAD(P)-dependent dehydrogenase (short-subunit alcohol dehydrogenase family)
MPPNFKRSVLITGGTAGLGYHCALNIAREYPAYQIVIASRSDANAAAESINKKLGQENVKFLPLDLSSLANVRSFARDWNANRFPPIQSLLLNAALQFPGEVEYTEDGFEKTFAISHIGHALLFSLLNPYLADTARIVITTSGTHDSAQKTGLPDAEYTTAEDLAHPPALAAKEKGRKRYATTKLVNVLYAYALHRRFASVNERTGKHWTVTLMDPGLMPGTGLARGGNGVEKFLWWHVLPHVKPLLRLALTPNVHTPEDSGAALARLAVGADVEGVSGVYFEGLKEIKSSDDSYDRAKQEDLWKWTVDTVACDERERSAFSLD